MKTPRRQNEDEKSKGVVKTKIGRHRFEDEQACYWTYDVTVLKTSLIYQLHPFDLHPVIRASDAPGYRLSNVGTNSIKHVDKRAIEEALRQKRRSRET